MASIRILVVDDSVVIRKLLCETLAKDPDLEVVASAGDGHIALAKIEQFHPDLVTLDIEMPVMNGLETLVEVRKLYPKMPVIMFSTLTERGASATLDALSLGASDYATKPSNTGSAVAAIAAIHAELVPKIKALCRGVSTKLKSLPPPRPPVRVRVPAHRRIEIVAIGTSTGGPNALAEVLPRIPKDFPVPIVVVQHMPPIFTRMLADRLASHSEIPVEEGSAGVVLSPGRSWIAPGNFHMTVAHAGVNWRLELNQDPPEHSCRPAVDVLFRSVAAVCHSSVLGVVMTGTGFGRSPWRAEHSRSGRRGHHPGRGLSGGVGNARSGVRGGAGRRRLSPRSVGSGDHPPRPAESDRPNQPAVPSPGSLGAPLK